MKQEVIKQLYLKSLSVVRELVYFAEENHLTDEQWYLDFEDELNQLSTKDHNG